MSIKKSFTAALFASLLITTTLTTNAFAVNRGEVLKRLIEGGNFPKWEGKKFSDVPANSPYAPALEIALSLGILPPTESFEPTVSVANAETLMFALQTLGFHQEAKVASWILPNTDTKMPAYVAGYVNLARSVEPPAPESVTSHPWDVTTSEQLDELVAWTIRCRQSILWNVMLNRPEGTLWVHREFTGQPPSGWRLQLAAFDTMEKAQAFAAKNKGAIPLEVVSNGYDFSVQGPQVKSYAEAWGMSKSFPAVKNTLVVPGPDDSRALFWAAFSPQNAGAGRFTFAAQFNSRPMKLSDMASKSGAIAAINGGYFNQTVPIGTLINEGKTISGPYKERGIVHWNADGSVAFSAGNYTAQVSGTGNGGGQFAVQAGPLLYGPDRGYNTEDINIKVVQQRHPRTLVGWDGKKLWWMAVDGRSSWHSRGLTLEEEAALSHQLGYTAVLNLDGGGSTEMWWDGHVVNRVSDGRERRLPYGIVFPRTGK